MIKGKGQRLIPEELLKYLEAYKENHPDPTAGGGATLEDIVDSAGNKRFIEGEGTTLVREGFDPTYCKWSLSGTHLMCVLAGSCLAGTPFYANNVLATFELPNYVSDKIYTIWSDNLELRTVKFMSQNGTAQELNFFIKKDGNKLKIQNVGTQKDVTYDSNFRIQVDLLIDSVYS